MMTKPEARDGTFESFLRHETEEASALAAESDLLDLQPLPGSPPGRFVVEYRCTGLVRADDESIRKADRFAVGIWLPSDYLRRAAVPEVLTWLGPLEVWHPNIQPPLICLGHLAPGTPLVDLLYRCYEVICYQRCTMREDNALNWQACRWARGHQSRFPIDRRPLKWRKSGTGTGTTTPTAGRIRP
jgi:hypothetical protein